MRLLSIGCALAGMLAAANPAVAVTTRFRVTGILDAPTGAALGLPLAAGNGFNATFTLADGGQPQVTTPLGGQGQARLYAQTLRQLDIVLNTAAGAKHVRLKPGKTGNGLVYDNGFSVRTAGLIDYGGFVVPVEGSASGIVPLLTADLALSPGVFLANFSFARVGSPGLLGSPALPDFASFFGVPGATYFGLFSFRSGTAFTAAQFNALPLAEVTITSAQVAVVPEPGTWALLVVGFGLIGTALRRAATPAPSI